MHFEKKYYTVEEIMEGASEQFFHFYPVLYSPEMDTDLFTFIVDCIIDGTFPTNYDLYTIKNDDTRENFYHSSSLASRLINFPQSSEFNALSEEKQNIFLNCSFTVNSLVAYETNNDAMNFLDKIFNVKSF